MLAMMAESLKNRALESVKIIVLRPTNIQCLSMLAATTNNKRAAKKIERLMFGERNDRNTWL